MPRQYYIRATGATCYDRTGVTFPVKEPVDWDALLEGLKAPAPRWEREFGWDNQPEVLVFSATNEESDLVDERVFQHPALKNRAFANRRNWRAKRK